MKTAHSPGPWTVELDVASSGDIDVMAADMVMVARIDCRETPDDEDRVPREVALENANAIAAVPDLMKALKDVEAHHVAVNARAGRAESNSRTLRIVRAAIAKAEGGA